MHEDSVRRQLLPFDEIQVQPERVNRRDLKNFIYELNKERQKIDEEKAKKLKILLKIGDPSYPQIQPDKNFFFKQLIKFDEEFRVFTPESRWMLLWNFLVLLSILFNFFQLPIALFLTENVYEDQVNTSVGLAINIIVMLILFIDTFFVRFNLAFYKNGKKISKRIQIFQKNIKLRFWVDFISFIVLFVYIVGGDWKLIYLKLIFYIKLYSLYIIDQEILDWLDVHAKSFALYRLFRLVIFLWYFTTLVSTIYFAIDYHYYQQGSSNQYYRTGQLWLTYSSIVQNLNMVENFPWYVMYQYAVYWSLQTSTACGYGDVTPKNPPEVLYCNIVIIVNTLFFAYYINGIWVIIGDLHEPANRFSENWGNLKNMIKDIEVPKNVKNKISSFLRQAWRYEDKEQLEELIGQYLSEQLKDELYLSSRGKALTNVPIFIELNQCCLQAKKFFTELVYSLQNQSIGTDEIIYKNGNRDLSLYYLRRGKVEVYVERPEIGIQVQIKENFGTQQFLTEQSRFSSARALTFCQVWKVSHEKFKQYLKQHSQVHEKYSELRQSVIIYKNVKLSDIKCINCNNNAHFTRECDIINRWRKTLRNPQQVILRSYLQNDQPIVFREKIKRRDRTTTKIMTKSLPSKQITLDQVKKYRFYRSDNNIL